MGCSKSGSERKVQSKTFFKKQEKFQANNLNLYLKELEKEKQMKELKIRVEVNEIESLKIEKINETESCSWKKWTKSISY